MRLSPVQSSSWGSVALVHAGAASAASQEGRPMSAWSSVMNLEEEKDGEGLRGESLSGSCHALSQGSSMDGTGMHASWPPNRVRAHVPRRSFRGQPSPPPLRWTLISLPDTSSNGTPQTSTGGSPASASPSMRTRSRVRPASLPSCLHPNAPQNTTSMARSFSC